jgi:hypothetical protein
MNNLRQTSWPSGPTLGAVALHMDGFPVSVVIASTLASVGSDRQGPGRRRAATKLNSRRETRTKVVA